MKQKLLYICLMILCALAWSGEAWGEERTVTDHNYSSTPWTYEITKDDKVTNNSFSFSKTENDVTVTFVFSEGSLQKDDSSLHSIKMTSSSGTGILTWNVPEGYNINVTKVSVIARGSSEGWFSKKATLKIASGKETEVGIALTSGVTVSSNSLDLGNTGSVNFSYTRNSSVAVYLYSFSITYKLTHKEYRYYAKSTATAVPASGVSAYTSFTSNDAANSGSDTKNSGWIRDASATTNVYYKAAANTGSYVFKGWTEATKTYSEANKLSSNLQVTYHDLENEDFEYNGALSTSPTLAAYKAWFAPKATFIVSADVGKVDGGSAWTDWTESSKTLEGTPGETKVSTSVTYSADVSDADSYKFCGWAESKAETNTSNIKGGTPYEVTLEGSAGSTVNKTLYAIFAPIYNFSATAEVGSVKGGTVSVSGYSAQVEGTPNAEEGTTTATFTATAYDGYKFMGWSETANGTIIPGSNVSPYKTSIENKTPGSTAYMTLYAIFKLDGLELNPGDPSYTPDTYSSITLSRTLKAGYSTIALPFDTDVATLTGRAVNDDDWVAQLDIVTYNAQDGFTLYFQKVDGGTITANQPYVLHLGSEVVNPTWTDLTDGISVEAAEAGELAASTGYSGYESWVMKANYEAGFSMAGKYGIVNSKGGLMLGSGEDAKLNAFTAYITGPTSGPNGAPQLRVAYVDEDGTATFIGSLPEDDLQGEPVAIYGPDGQRRSKMQRGVNIVRYADGTTRKINY